MRGHTHLFMQTLMDKVHHIFLNMQVFPRKTVLNNPIGGIRKYHRRTYGMTSESLERRGRKQEGTLRESAEETTEEGENGSRGVAL